MFRGMKGRGAISRVTPCLLLALPFAVCSRGAYSEAPMLAELVAKGELPPVEKRLSDEPFVLEPVHRVGVYGGTWRRLAIRPSDSLMGSRLGYEPLVRWDRTGRRVVPGLADTWEVRDQGREYAFHLRPGLKWSDGHPFTSEAFTFWYEDIVQDEELTPVPPTWLTPSGGRFSISGPEPGTVVFRFDRPNGIFLETLAYRGHFIYKPGHYLKQFHAKYTAKEQLEKEAKKLGLDLWYQLFAEKSNLHENPDLPTVLPWKITVPPPATRFVAERNPYYWKVDPEGNQLPYIDRITFTLVQNNEILNLKAMTGGVDMQARYIDSSKYTLFMENRKKGKYRVVSCPAPGAAVIYLNQYSKNPEVRALLQDRRFRIALSVAIDRDELIEFIFGGLAEPSNGVSGPFDPYYLPEFAARHVPYDPALANQLLDEAGMARTGGGMRRMPNGKRFRQILHYYPAETGTGPETWQLVVEYWREVGLDFIAKDDARTLSTLQVSNGNSDFWAYAIAGMHWVIDPGWYVPVRDGAYFAPMYGRYVARRGKSGVPPSAEFQRLLDWYAELAGCYGDEERKLDLGRRILSQWVDECYIVGIARKTEIAIVSNRFGNMPDTMIQSWRLMTPGYLGPEQFYIDETPGADLRAGRTGPAGTQKQTPSTR